MSSRDARWSVINCKTLAFLHADSKELEANILSEQVPQALIDGKLLCQYTLIYPLNNNINDEKHLCHQFSHYFQKTQRFTHEIMPPKLLCKALLSAMSNTLHNTSLKHWNNVRRAITINQSYTTAITQVSLPTQ